jgi:hypothetical protein
MENDNILHREMITWQLMTSFRSTSKHGQQNIKGWARGEFSRTMYMKIVKTDTPLWLHLNAEIFRCFHTRKRIEQSLLQPISVIIVYNIIFTWNTKTHETMLEPTAATYGCQTWNMLGEEHFEEGVCASKWVRGLENQNQPRTEGIT